MTDDAEQDPILAALAELLPHLERGGVTELDVSVGDTRLFLRRRPGPAAAEGAPSAAPPEEDEGLIAIATPLSGVFYASPAPDEPPYIAEGDEVTAGQTVALVEAMKVFNEIHAEVPGTIEKILVTPGQLVSSGQPLMRLRPSAAALASESV
jgi:acetyl-CoA carboxylase biotin carboxyl carrier protein